MRSAECEKETLESEEMERNVCSACLSLGAAHSVSWLKMGFGGPMYADIVLSSVQSCPVIL